MGFAEDLKNARAGDTAAVDRLFHQRRNSLRTLAKRILPPKLQPRVDQSDLVQDAFLKVIRGINAFDGDSEETFDCWLATALRQACLDAINHHLGTQKRNPDRPISAEGVPVIVPDGSNFRDATDSTPSHHAELNELAVRIAWAKGQLDPVQDQILTLRYEHKLTLRKIAEQVGLTENQVTGLWRRALDKLARLLASEGEPPEA